jgi:hypothetical protein
MNDLECIVGFESEDRIGRNTNSSEKGEERVGDCQHRNILYCTLYEADRHKDCEECEPSYGTYCRSTMHSAKFVNLCKSGAELEDAG